jgi:hypothetical protein
LFGAFSVSHMNFYHSLSPARLFWRSETNLVRAVVLGCAPCRAERA